jgi:hypothetical protein
MPPVRVLGFFGIRVAGDAKRPRLSERQAQFQRWKNTLHQVHQVWQIDKLKKLASILWQIDAYLDLLHYISSNSQACLF